MIVVLIKQSDANIRVRGELAGTVQARETTTYDHDMLFGLWSLFHRLAHATLYRSVNGRMLNKPTTFGIACGRLDQLAQPGSSALRH